MDSNATRPNWDHLYEVTSIQEGHFTTAQAAEATLRDCAEANVPPDLVWQARDEGLDRGLFTRSEVAAVDEYLARFGEAA